MCRDQCSISFKTRELPDRHAIAVQVQTRLLELSAIRARGSRLTRNVIGGIHCEFCQSQIEELATTVRARSSTDFRSRQFVADGLQLRTSADSESAPRTTVLLVGSGDELAHVLTEALPGWRIELVANNLTALAAIKAHAFELVVTSEKTSGKADVELLREIRRVRPHVRLIILTSEGTPADVIQAMREHAFSYFSTPFVPESFVEIVRLAAYGPCWDDGIEVMSGTPAWISLLVRCEKRTADRLFQFIEEIIDLPEPERGEVAVAFREMLLNAIEHGGHFDPTQYVEISYVQGRHAVLCRIKDPGQGFSFDEIKHAAVANPPDDPLQHQACRDAKGLRPGGFGVLITRSLVDEVIYGEIGNEVLLIKYLNVVGTNGVKKAV